MSFKKRSKLWVERTTSNSIFYRSLRLLREDFRFRVLKVAKELLKEFVFFLLKKKQYLLDTRRRINVYNMSVKRYDFL